MNRKNFWHMISMSMAFGGFSVLLFFLYDLPWEPCMYLCFFCCTLIVCTCGARAYRERRAGKQILHLPEEVLSCLEEKHFPQAATQVEAAYQKMALLLSRQCRKEQEEKRRQLDVARQYYTRWSHQIKTPIAGMRLLLEEETIDRNAMERELLHTEQYVETALQYQRLGSGSKDLVIRKCRIEMMVKQAVKRAAVLFLQKKISIELGELDAEVVTDEKWFVFVLEQLVTNAVKYTKEGGKIRIFLEGGKRRTLIVEDTGIGIMPEDLPRIFEWGYTGYNGRLQKNSTGIGLALCRQTLDMLGHGIRVESETGKGTRFFLDLGEERGI